MATQWLAGWLNAGLVLLVAWLLFGSPGARGDEAPAATVTGPYLELRSGPGRGYPVFHTVERGGEVQLLKRRTDWIKVRTAGGVEGWVARAALEAGGETGARLADARDLRREAYRDRRMEFGFAASEFDGDRAFTFRGGYRLSEHFTVELALTEVAGSFSSSTLYHGNLQVTPMELWRVSPFFTLGVGRFENEPKAVLVEDEEISEWAANAGVGLRAWLTRRFVLRADYRLYVVTNGDEDNEDFDEWGLGFSVFF